LPLRYPRNPISQIPPTTVATNSPKDHTLGIPQFLRGGQTSILASAAGRDFVESDLAGHGLYRPIKEPLQPWKVTHWAQAFEKLSWPLKKPSIPSNNDDEAVDLGITILHTPGHTPDELAWYDDNEMFLYVGDSFYERGGEEGMDIIFPAEGNLVEWYFSLMKMRGFVRSRNASEALAEGVGDGDEDWIKVSRRVKVGCGHQTAGADAEYLLRALEDVWWRVLRGEVPVVETMTIAGEVCERWMEPGGDAQFSFRAPRRLMVEAREFFSGSRLG
jgi:glyoxylase-like metal-dependent hydrolase (beta-lactamase superfamily II)